MKSYFLILILVIFSFSVLAHKDAPSTGLESGDLSVELEVRPQQVVVGKAIIFHLVVLKKGTSLSGAKVNFEVMKTATSQSPEELIGEFSAEEIEPGVYHAEYTFPEIHSYKVEGHVEDGFADVHIEKFIDAEAKGPSMLFWGFMILTILVSLFIGYRGAEIL